MMTEEQLLMLIPTPPQPARCPAEPIIREADTIPDFRFAAKRAWGAGPCVLWAMTNPSLADGNRDDPTMRRIMGFSYRWGYGSAVVVNVYPFVTPSMKALDRWRRLFHPRVNASGEHVYPYTTPTLAVEASRVFDRNQRTIREQVNAAQLHVAAWGHDVASADLETFLRAAVIRVPEDDEFGDAGITVAPIWHVIGLNDDGTPRHPLARGRYRIPDDQKPILWSAP